MNSYVQSVPLGEAIEIDAVSEPAQHIDLSTLFVNVDARPPRLPSFEKLNYNLDTYEKNDTWLGTDQDFLLLLREHLLAHDRIIFSFLCTSLNRFVFFIFGSLSESDLRCFHPNEIPTSNTPLFSGWCSLVPDTYYRPVVLSSLMQFIDDLLVVHHLDLHRTKPLHQFAWISRNVDDSGSDGNTITYTRFWFWDMQVLFTPPRFIFLFYEDDYVRYRNNQSRVTPPVACTQYLPNKHSIAVYYYEMSMSEIVERVVPIHTPTMFLFFEKYARHLFDIFNNSSEITASKDCDGDE